MRPLELDQHAALPAHSARMRPPMFIAEASGLWSRCTAIVLYLALDQASQAVSCYVSVKIFQLTATLACMCSPSSQSKYIAAMIMAVNCLQPQLCLKLLLQPHDDSRGEHQPHRCTSSQQQGGMMQESRRDSTSRPQQGRPAGLFIRAAYSCWRPSATRPHRQQAA